MIEVRQGDCVELMKTMADESVDCIVTDPPYGMSFVSNHRQYDNPITVPILNDDGFDETFHRAWISEAFRVLKDGGACYSFASDHHLGEFRRLFADVGFTVKRTLIWMKSNWGMGDLKGDYANRTEFIIYAAKGRHILNGRRDTNVLEYPREVNGKRKVYHSCQKPVALISYLLDKSSTSGSVILDPFNGAGSTGIACAEHQRHYIGIELQPEYVTIANARISGSMGWANENPA